MKKTVIKAMAAASLLAATGAISPMNAQTLCFPSMQVISNNDPTLTFSVDPGCTPNAGCGTYYSWNFGDGNTLVTATPTVMHTYTSNGNYWASVCPVDSCWSGTANSYSCTAVSVNISGNSGSGGGGGNGGNFCNPILTIINNNDPTYTFSVNTGCSTNPGCITYYQWNFGDGNVLTTTSPTVSHTYSNNGNYAVFVCPFDSCTSGGTANSYSCDVVYVNPGGGSGTFTCSVSLAIVADSLNPGDYWYYYGYSPSNATILNYQWFVINASTGYSVSANGPSPIFNLPPGTYTVCLTMDFASGTQICSSTDCQIVSDSTNNIWLYKMGTTGLKLTTNEISANIYPNPAKDILFVTLANSSSNDGVNVIIKDLSGRIVKTMVLTKDGQINVSELAKGSYIIQIFTSKGFVNQLWIKE